jgi:hypothetical protein
LIQSELYPTKIEFEPFLFTVMVITVVKSQIRMETAQNCLGFFFSILTELETLALYAFIFLVNLFLGIELNDNE